MFRGSEVKARRGGEREILERAGRYGDFCHSNVRRRHWKRRRQKVRI